MKYSAYGLPMDSGGWLRWLPIANVMEKAVPPLLWPETQRFTLYAFCVICSIGDNEKQRFQFAVLLRKPEMRKQLKTRLERFATVFAIRALSGHTENDWLKTPRYAVRLKPEDHQWMSVLSHNTFMCNLDSILTTGLVHGGI